jgi:hypothetical protein
MSYYPTLDEDLQRAKAILAKGRDGVTPLEGIDGPVVISLGGASISGGDIYVAYRLLDGFVEAIEQYRAAIAAERIDHNWECLDCDEQHGHRLDCPWLERVRALLSGP